MNRSDQQGFDLHAVPKYPWEDGEEWDRRRHNEIQRRLEGRRSDFPHVTGPLVKREVIGKQTLEKQTLTVERVHEHDV